MDASFVHPSYKTLGRTTSFFTVPSISGAQAVAASLGGALFGQEYAGPGFKVRNGCDPEGNVLQVRENTP